MYKRQIAIISSDTKSFLKISNQLNNKEYKVIIYENISKVINIDINLILIDTNIGYEESINAIKKIRNHFLKVQIGIILCIDKTNIKNLKEYIEIGADDYLLNPFTVEELYIRVNNQIKLMEAKKNSKIKDIQFNALLNNTPFMAWFKDKDSNYIKVNNEFMEHSGKTMEQIKGTSDHYVWNGNVGNRCREYDLEVMNKRKQVVFDEVILGKKGYKQFNMYKAPVLDEFDEVIGTIGIARDITELKNKDAKLQILMDNLPFPVWLSDTNGVYINGNKKFTQYFNITVDELIGETPKKFYSEDHVKEIYKQNKEVIKRREPMKFEEIVETQQGIRQVEIYKTPVFDIGNEVIGITSALTDVTDIKEAQKEIKKQALTDSLTQISNRRALYDYMDEETDYSKIGMMFVDIDNFKDINDYYGHHFGDEVIIYVSNKLKEVCKDIFICRLGGDEFLAVFKNLENEKIICDKAKEILEKTYIQKNNKKYDFSVSIGIAMGDSTADIDRLFMKVDIAMYKAKELGKNKFMTYTKELEEEKNLNLNIEKDLEQAIEKNEVKLFYQPQYTTDKKLKGFEALFRWQNDKYKNIPVIEIIEIMESSNLIIHMGYYIMREACEFAKKINKNMKEKIIVSVNISAIQIMEKDFIKKIKSIINEIGVDIDCIGIEITETVLLKNIEENIKKIKELKDMGITISLDDFGSGYSSLNYIVKLPLSIIKIDKSFIRGMDVKEEYIKLLKLIIESAHLLNLPIVAEGVETEEQLDRLNKMNVDYIQGYLFSKPLEEKDALKLL
ncbi:EAL domain-containing protein [Clostridium uliginosum]|uniref:Stage 0 sporulation protein A homolog n=1 Tax=Clostridium uliginosum TaxID=119641 RepID=A0A1I1RID3_9CLOT|nr:EAL domain-containing protein [Clostridium uliginosum]SFD33942.1 PAS domain S-box-containing protein/diguanylate cyclase (GGDEF) domain-containing protein [Clostridium uliginosum]